jgi:putative SOS response-associated peptidase YedK
VCGRYAAAKDTTTIVEEFSVEQVVDPAPQPSWNVAPTDTVAFVVERPVSAGAPAEAPGGSGAAEVPVAAGAQRIQRQLRAARWGLVPSWAKDPAIGNRMINARWEQAAEKPAFRAAFARRRCLIPADGYFEWYATAQAGASGKPRKQPYFIHRADGRALALAGLYEFWRPDPEADWLVTVSVLTTSSAGPLAALHDRMPVVIDPAGYGAWLDPTTAVGPDFDATLAVDLLEVYPVATTVNSVRNDGPELIEPLPAEEAQDVPGPPEFRPEGRVPAEPGDPQRPAGR